MQSSWVNLIFTTSWWEVNQGELLPAFAPSGHMETAVQPLRSIWKEPSQTRPEFAHDIFPAPVKGSNALQALNHYRENNWMNEWHYPKDKHKLGWGAMDRFVSLLILIPDPKLLLWWLEILNGTHLGSEISLNIRLMRASSLSCTSHRIFIRREINRI